MLNIGQLVSTVQKNCHISDAQHAGKLTLCIYLLKMREFYRWENDIPLTRQLAKDDVGRWLQEREQMWEHLEANRFDPIPLEHGSSDPFDTDDINRELVPQGYVYSGGVGRFCKPHFFLGELLRRERRGAVDILVSGREYVRDLNAAPAALQRGTVYLRQEALRRWLWEKIEGWNLRQRDGAIKATLDSYGYAADPLQAIESMTIAESETLILHELGEHAAGEFLGPDWEGMLQGMSSRRAEILARAVRDNLADCLSTLPALLQRDAQASLHFWFANFDGMRQVLFPSLTAAYAAWSESGDALPLQAALVKGTAHWQALATRLLEIYRQRGATADSQIEALAEKLDALAL